MTSLFNLKFQTRANPWEVEIIPHPVQHRLISEEKRFKVVAAGRRSGKTFWAKRYLCEEAFFIPGRYFAAAPTRDQAKGIFWEDLKAYCLGLTFKTPNESELKIVLRNGSIIIVIGLDKPQRFEGQPWTGGVIDEFDDLKQDTWKLHVRPALDTIGLNTWCWLLGVPNGLYLLYELKDHAVNYPDEWGYYHWPSEEILTPEIIEAAKRDLSPIQYRQEYLAAFEAPTGRVYGDYSSPENITDRTLDPTKPIIWTHDFNFTPMSSAIIQEDEFSNSYVVDEIILESASAKHVVDEFVDRFSEYEFKTVFLYGDRSGRNGEKHGLDSDYDTIKQILAKYGWSVVDKVPKANGPIKEGQNSLRARILNNGGQRRFFVNQNKAPYCHMGLHKLQLKKGSAFQEEEEEYQHITTALRYYTGNRFPIKIRTKVKARAG